MNEEYEVGDEMKSLTKIIFAGLMIFQLTAYAQNSSVPSMVDQNSTEARMKKELERIARQHSLPLDSLYRRYIDNPPILPEDYPAKHYDKNQLLRRFVEIANGPVLKREQLEQEFGIHFISIYEKEKRYGGIAQGRFPLGNKFSQYTTADDGSISIRLDLQQLQSEGFYYRPWGDPELCVITSDFYNALDEKWKRIERYKETHLPLMVFYEKKMNDQRRSIMLEPAEKGNCIDVFKIIISMRLF
jgi:hypothetical protein